MNRHWLAWILVDGWQRHVQGAAVLIQQGRLGGRIHTRRGPHLIYQISKASVFATHPMPSFFS